MQVIYIDMLFLLNFIMDLLILWMSGKILGSRSKIRSLLIGSILAAVIYCIIMILPFFDHFPLFLLQLFIPIGSILIIFKPTTMKQFLRCYFIATLTAWIVGGMTFNVYYIFLKGYAITAILPITIGISLCVIVFMSLQWIRRRMIAPYFEYKVILHSEGEKCIKLNGYLDTGNRLYTLKDTKPVIVGYYEALYPILSQNQRSFLEMCKAKGIEKSLEHVTDYGREKYYLLPFNSVGCTDGMLIGIPVDKIVIKRGDWQQEYRKGVIGIQFTRLFNGDHYDLLIHPDYIKIE